VGYFRRFGVWPDCAVMRGVEQTAEIATSQVCKVRMLAPRNDTEGEGGGHAKNACLGEVVIERVGWMRAGDVGVYKKGHAN
jgi:hypothetical protein